MARRIEIELTSTREDGFWTWRAAGAKQPRGLVAADVLPPGTKIGDTLRVDAEFGIDGIEVTGVVPQKMPSKEPDRLEILAPREDRFAGVTATLVERAPRQSRPRRSGDGASRRRERSPRASSSSPRRSGEPAARRSAESTPRGSAPSSKPRSRPSRLVPKTVHRDAFIESLPIEQRPIAEQLASGGLPAVRRALDEQRTKDREQGRPPTPGDTILTLAEQMLSPVREATWLDRAEAAAERLDSIALRDLRATVTGAVARSDAARALHARLRSALDERLARLHANWEEEMTRAIADGRTLQALRLSAKPPEPSARVPAKLVEPLAVAASEALNDQAQPTRWIMVLEAAAASPVRRSVRPKGIPADSTNAARQAASAAAGRIPALAKLLGLAIPPPPRPMATKHVVVSVATPDETSSPGRDIERESADDAPTAS